MTLAQLQALINLDIYENTSNAITGANLNTVLQNIVSYFAIYGGGNLITSLVPITPSDTVTFTPGTAGLQFLVTVPGNIKVGWGASGVTQIIPFNEPGLFEFDWVGINQIYQTVANSATFTAWAAS